ncbi:MAG: T9SS type A sorting domain-containing protein [Calditrichaeota bacterium]|nr:T9SS type A sorting domain-containing protein [Candidatus Cloacimonadota bacterium]MCA9784927.1 T9SS type A sorting domain-containing protein [Candidatus Cloacimonadota bacterium]MCB1045777.1 T9SS type A sorting domain-containing protein [Calditrichota bacterium]MCB9475006.1 T9SS type A sorting domain-containing protein [Candidatus Delongbacteria bacterium]
MMIASIGVVLLAMVSSSQAEYQIDFSPDSLPSAHGYPLVEACFIAVDGTPLGCFDAVMSISGGFPVMYHAVWTNDSQIQEAWLSSMTLSFDCNGYQIDSTIEFAPFEAMYYAGPANPPAAPTVFPIDPSIDCSTYTAAVEDQPGAFHLGSAYPNPFNPSTTIRFTLAETASVDLGVFDITGRRVATLEAGMRSSGEHEAVFDGSTLASGLYLVKLESGREVAVKKVVLAK